MVTSGTLELNGLADGLMLFQVVLAIKCFSTINTFMFHTILVVFRIHIWRSPFLVNILPHWSQACLGIMLTLWRPTGNWTSGCGRAVFIVDLFKAHQWKPGTGTDMFRQSRLAHVQTCSLINATSAALWLVSVVTSVHATHSSSYPKAL